MKSHQGIGHASIPGKKCPSYGLNAMDGPFSYLFHYHYDPLNGLALR